MFTFGHRRLAVRFRGALIKERESMFKGIVVTAAFVCVSAIPTAAQDAGGPLAAQYRSVAQRIITTSLADSAAYNRLAKLTDTFGNRISGSTNLERAIDWILAQMKSDGLQDVHGERVMVPHWVRGDESATLLSPRKTALHMIGLGMSIGTPAQGITAPVLVVSSFEDLAKHAAEAKGKIVLYTHAFPQDSSPFAGYGDAVRYRGIGADEASKLGAVAALIRSVSSFSMQNPHSGSMRYDTTGKVKKIPAAALSVEDAMMLERMAKRGENVVVNLKMSAKKLTDAPSRNVVAQITGSQKPDEVVVLGGHIDSWDVGQGAMDDGGGAVAAWEAVRLIQRLGLKPKRTVRVVFWTNEENGGRGGEGYRDAHASEIDKHVFAMESDNGVFKPFGYSVGGGDSALRIAQDIASLMAPIGAAQAIAGGPEADVSPLYDRGVPVASLVVDGSRYFWYHHSSADTMDKLDPREMAQCVAMLAVMAYVVADMPGTLPRVPVHQTNRRR